MPILEFLGFQFFESSVRSLLLDGQIKLLVFLRFIPFNDFQFFKLSGRRVVEELIFHDIVDLVVSFLILVRLFGLDIIYVRENCYWLEILRFMSGVPIPELVLVVLIFILYFSQFLLSFDLMLLFLLVFVLHLLKLIPPFGGHHLHPVSVLTLVFRDYRIDFSGLPFG